MIMTDWVFMMERVVECVMGGALVLTSVVPMGLWLVWWRAATLGICKDIAGENSVDEMVVKMMVVDMD